ncbi:30S ribosomal protein S4 [Marispirochaeta sp.]|uniref:30S ribosomal protein S4 n=1 Tax=Marispirochaeta sp. TaxID=2038653 RepID=UPI0029C8E9A2|nr:30S ribosomal protein S4 [Marispirochaeta sp.]
MARYVGPSCRLCRAEHTKLFLKGERCNSPKCPINKKRPAPGKGPRERMKKMSDYGIQLREKQKLKRMYMLLEKQFKILFTKAERMKGITGENLITLLESRIDNIVYRMHFASSRSQARQLVSHGHVRVNGRRVTIPSYLVRENDVIEVQEASKKLVNIKESLKQFSRSGVSPWLELNPDEMKGKVLALPRRSDVTELADVKEHLIVELYSR